MLFIVGDTYPFMAYIDLLLPHAFDSSVDSISLRATAYICTSAHSDPSHKFNTSISFAHSSLLHLSPTSTMAATCASVAKKASKSKAAARATAARAAALTAALPTAVLPAAPTTVLPASAPPAVAPPAVAPPAAAPPAAAMPAMPAVAPPITALPATAPRATASKGRRHVRIVTPEYVSSGDTETASSSHEHSTSTKDELAYLRKQVDRYRVQKARTRKARSHRHRYLSSGSSSSSSDSEGYGSRVSFKDNEGNKPFLKLHERYRAVNVKYFKQIYLGKFQPKHLTRLAHNYSNWSTDKKDRKDDDVQEATGLNQLL